MKRHTPRNPPLEEHGYNCALKCVQKCRNKCTRYIYNGQTEEIYSRTD